MGDIIFFAYCTSSSQQRNFLRHAVSTIYCIFDSTSTLASFCSFDEPKGRLRPPPEEHLGDETRERYRQTDEEEDESRANVVHVEGDDFFVVLVRNQLLGDGTQSVSEPLDHQAALYHAQSPRVEPVKQGEPPPDTPVDPDSDDLEKKSFSGVLRCFMTLRWCRSLQGPPRFCIGPPRVPPL
jgi:hypothetical protein